MNPQQQSIESVNKGRILNQVKDEKQIAEIQYRLLKILGNKNSIYYPQIHIKKCDYSFICEIFAFVKDQLMIQRIQKLQVFNLIRELGHDFKVIQSRFKMIFFKQFKGTFENLELKNFNYLFSFPRCSLSLGKVFQGISRSSYGREALLFNQNQLKISIIL